VTTSPALSPWPRRPARLATAVIEELADRIVGGAFPAGSTLPTEPVLGETFGVSRSVLREAIKALEAMGLVKVQQGQGTTVLPQAEWDLVNPVVLAAVIRHDAAWSVLDHLVKVRRALESQMASQAAGLITEEGKRIVNERMADLELAVEDADAFSAADVAFHDAILTASGNLLGRAIIRSLTVEAYRSLRYIGQPSTADRQHTNEDHRAIRDAIERGDAQAAGELMDHHIASAWERRRPAQPDGPPV
jgi:DNA-binding FadR family transcriptional regulator